MMKKTLIMMTVCAALAASIGTANATNYFTETFDTNPDLSVWTVDRHAPSTFTSENFDGDNRLKIGISSTDLQSYGFYNTQGRSIALGNSAPTSISGDLYIGDDWATSVRRSDIWGGTIETAHPTSDYAWAIFGFVNESTTNPNSRFRVWDADAGTDDGWVNLSLPTNFEYNKWYNLAITLTPTSFDYYLNGNLVYTDTTILNSDQFRNMIIQAKNYGENYNVYWDNVSAGPATNAAVPEPMSIMLGIMGLGSVAGFKRLRRK